jgi:ATP-dependent helicase/nuclease subunit A
MTASTRSQSYSDAEARLRALTATESFIVQAPAGSGKTELLIQRMLALLARANHPSEILAITFTKKAAGEMRTRLLDALSAARSEPAPPNSPERERWQLAKAVLARDAARDWKLLQRPTLLNIDTFDAFSLRIVRASPYQSDTKNVALATLQEDTSDLYREAARRALLDPIDDAHRNAVTTLLLALDNRVDDIAALLAELLGKRAQWIDQIVDDSDDAIEAIQRMIATSVEAELAHLRDIWPSQLSAYVHSSARYASEHIEEKARLESLLLASNAELRFTSIDALHEWTAVTGLLLRNDGGWRVRINKLDGFPSPSDTGISAQQKRERKQAIEAFKQLLDEFQRLDHAELLRDSLHRLRALPGRAAISSHESVLRATLSVLKVSVAELLLLESERGSIDFAGVSIAAKLAMIEHRDEVYAQFESGVAHILIDEFQDTNPAQAALIAALIEDWHDGDGRTLFLVGDPMQSIYAFRDADVGIFVDAWTRGLGHLALTALTLHANYRSRKALVDWVNRSIGQTFRQASPQRSLARIPFAASQATRDDAIEPHAPRCLCFDTEDAEARAIALDIARVRADTPHETIAILVRAKQHANSIIRALEAAAIAFSARELANWSDRAMVRDLVSLTYVIAQPGDRLSWYAWLRSPLVGLTLASLAAVSEWQASTHSGIEETLRDEDFRATLNDNERLLIENALAALDRVAARANLESLANRVHAVFLACGGDSMIDDDDACIETTDYFAFLEAQCLDGLLPPRDHFEAKLAKQTRSFSAALPPSHEAQREIPAVEIMTIHKAKGLEWHHVYLPQFDRPSGKNERQLIVWQFWRSIPLQSGEQRDSSKATQSQSNPTSLLVAAKQSRRSSANSVYDFVLARQQEALAEETKRLLYVATTRARERLTITGADTPMNRSPRAGTLAAMIDWPHREIDTALGIESGLREPNKVQGRVVYAPSLSRLNVPRNLGGAAPSRSATPSTGEFANHRVFLESEREREDASSALAQRKEIALGIVGHALIEGLAAAARASSKTDVSVQTGFRPSADAIYRMLIDEGANADFAKYGGATLMDAVAIMKRSALFARIHDPTHTDYADELTLSIANNDTKRLVRVDRTFVDRDGVRWIVDYKFVTGAPAPERYRTQLDSYRDAFAIAEPERAIRCALYFPLTDQLEFV